MPKKVSTEIEDNMYKAYRNCWSNGMFRVKMFQDYMDLTDDLERDGYDVSEYRRLIKIIKESNFQGKAG